MKKHKGNTTINDTQRHFTRIRVILSIFVITLMLINGIHPLICLAIAINMWASIILSVGVAQQNNINKLAFDCINLLATETKTDLSVTPMKKKG